MPIPSSSSPGPIILTRDQDLLDQLLRLCAAANVTPDVIGDPTRARQGWQRASAILVGDDQAAALARVGLARRDHLVLVSQARDSAPLWQLAVEVRADEVAVLPAAQGRLVERLGDLADGAARATTVAVIGGCGGAGSSITAAALALTAARGGQHALLIDADPLGGGLELVVGCEDRPGLRWPEVAAAGGRVSAAAFRAALPTVGSLAVLSWDREAASQPSAETIGAMVRAAQRGSEVVVIDLPRRLDEAASEALVLGDALVVVTTSDVRAVASTRGLVRGLRDLCADIRQLVREMPGSDVAPSAVAGMLQLPLVATVPTGAVWLGR